MYLLTHRPTRTIKSPRGRPVAFFSFFFPSPLLSSPFYSLSLLVVTQIRGHMAGSSPPLPHYGSCLSFLSREDFSSFFRRRLASNCAYPRKGSKQLMLFFYVFSQINSKARHGGIRTYGPTLLLIVLIAFEGYH